MAEQEPGRAGSLGDQGVSGLGQLPICSAPGRPECGSSTRSGGHPVLPQGLLPLSPLGLLAAFVEPLRSAHQVRVKSMCVTRGR